MIVTLIGSTRFEPFFHVWNEVLGLAGHPVFSLSCLPSRGFQPTADEKIVLDQVHKQKIERSDAVLLLNVFGYIGASTMSEIKHAVAHDKKR